MQGTVTQPVLHADNIDVHYGAMKALDAVSLRAPARAVTALIGPSGCGKSTLLRCFNRMNDYIGGFKLNGAVKFHGQDIYDDRIDPVVVRRRVGMVFQKPNPFPGSISKNITWGPKINGLKHADESLVETSLRKAALWDEVKDRLSESGLSLSGGQQQRLCIARAIAMKPEVILMDEPCASLDPTSTQKIEDLIVELKRDYSIVIVTHNMQQALRLSDFTGFMYQGRMIEYGPTEKIFKEPEHKLTKEYVQGKFG